MYTLQGKPNIHDMYAFHVSPRTPLVRFLWAVPVRGNLSRWLNIVGQIHCPREKMLPTPPLCPTEWLTGPASVSLPNTVIEAVRLSQTFVDEQATSVYSAYITSKWSVRLILTRRGQPIGP
jgi:hypothetical protein